MSMNRSRSIVVAVVFIFLQQCNGNSAEAATTTTTSAFPDNETIGEIFDIVEESSTTTSVGQSTTTVNNETGVDLILDIIDETPTNTTTATVTTPQPSMVTTSSVFALPEESTPSYMLPKMWEATQVPFVIEAPVGEPAPAQVKSVTIVSDHWMKRPKDIEITLLHSASIAGGHAPPPSTILIEYPRSLSVCGPAGNEPCDYPATPTSSYKVHICDGQLVSGIHSWCQLTKAVRVKVLTPLNDPGQGNDMVIISEVAVTTVGQTTTPPPSGNVKFELFAVGINCGELPDLTMQTAMLKVKVPNVNIPRSINNDPKIHGYQTGANWAARFTGVLAICTGGHYSFHLRLGHADTAALIVDGVEVARSGCNWGGSLWAEVYLASGPHDIQLIYADDGWYDEVVLSYSGADTCLSNLVVPPTTFVTLPVSSQPCVASHACPTSTTKSVDQLTTTANNGTITTTTSSTTEVRATTEDNDQPSTSEILDQSSTTQVIGEPSTTEHLSALSAINRDQRSSLGKGFMQAATSTTTSTTTAPPVTAATQGASGNVAVLGEIDKDLDNELAETEYVTMGLVVQRVDYSALVASGSMLEEFQLRVKKAIATYSGPAITTDDVSLRLSAGSVIVNASIRPRDLAEAEAIYADLSASSNLALAVAQTISSMKNVAAVSNGPIVVLKGAVDMKRSSAPTFNKDHSRAWPSTTTLKSKDEFEEISSAPAICGPFFRALYMFIWLCIMSAAEQGC